MKVDRKRRKKKREMSVAYKSMLERIVLRRFSPNVSAARVTGLSMTGVIGDGARTSIDAKSRGINGSLGSTWTTTGGELLGLWLRLCSSPAIISNI